MAAATVPTLPFPRPDPLAPAPLLAHLRQEAPVCPVRSSAGEPAWLVTGYDHARAVLADRRVGLALPGLSGGDELTNMSIFQDPPGHTRLRRLVSAAFTPRQVARLRSRVEDLAAGLAGDLAAETAPFDLMEGFAYPLAVTTIGELLGVPEGERASFRQWSDALMFLGAGAVTDPATGWRRLGAQVRDLLAAKWRRPADDLLSALVAVHDQQDGRLSDRELVVMAITLIIAGYVTTSVAVGVGAMCLAGDLGRLPRDPASTARAVEEVLRFHPAVGDAGRRAREDLDLGGVTVPAGGRIIVSLVAANRDPRRFGDPDRFDPTRADNPHLSFGYGIHHCLGAALARLELQAAFTALGARMPGLHLAVPAGRLTWNRSELFGDEWPSAVPMRA